MKNLSLLGLTNNETKIFEILIKKGKCTSAEICKHSGVSYSRIYDYLASLEHKGFIQTIPDVVKKFVPADPVKLKKIVEVKRKELLEIDKEIDNFKVFYENKAKDILKVVEGKNNFYKLYKEMPEPEKRRFSINYTLEYKPSWVRDLKLQVKRGVEVKNLVRVGGEVEVNLKKWRKFNSNIREIENSGVAMFCVDDKAVLISLIKSNVSFLVKDKNFVDLIGVLFKSYYDNKKDMDF